MLLAAVLLLRLALPAGYMPSFQSSGVHGSICPDATPKLHAHGAAKQTQDKKQTHDTGTAKRCAFADLLTPALGSADPIVPPALVAPAFTPARVFGMAPPPHAWERLRPPLRGPPVAP